MSIADYSLEEEIKARALRLGFSIVGITDASPLENFPVFQNWINQGYHAGMAYLQSPYHLERRKSPAEFIHGTKSVIVLGYSYPLHPLESLNDPSVGLISGYATGDDYHKRIPVLLSPIIDFLHQKLGKDSQVKVFSDSAPILERELAIRAGLGWIGRNSCLVNPKVGSTVLLAEILLSYSLKPDKPFTDDHCGTCRKCMEACPTGCILPNRTIDANKCISYHTIENRGVTPPNIMLKQANWVFGCDICQMVCPWNRKSLGEANTPVLPVGLMNELIHSPLSTLIEQFENSSVLRAKPSKLLCNLLIVLANQNSISVNELLTIAERTGEPGIMTIYEWKNSQKNLS